MSLRQPETGVASEPELGAQAERPRWCLRYGVGLGRAALVQGDRSGWAWADRRRAPGPAPMIAAPA